MPLKGNYLSSLPFLKLLQKTVQQDRDDSIWTGIKLCDDLCTLLPTIELHDDALMDGLALPAQVWGQFHGLSLML